MELLVFATEMPQPAYVSASKNPAFCSRAETRVHPRSLKAP